MKPFAVIHSIFRYTGYFENDKNPGWFPLNHLLSLIFWFGTWYCSLPAVFYFIFSAQIFREYSESFYFIVDGFLFVVVWPIFLFFKSTFYQLIHDYEQLILIRMELPLVKELYNDTNQNVEKLTIRFHFCLTRFLIPLLTLPSFFTSLYNYFENEGHCSDCFVISFPAVLPYDYKTPLLFTVTILMEIVGIFCVIEIFFSQTFLYVGLCRFSATFATDLDVNLKDLADQLSNEEELNCAKRVELMQKFKSFIRFQGDSKQLAYRCSNVNELINFLSLLCAVILLCYSLLQFQFALDTEDYVKIIQSIASNVCHFSWIYLLCNNGDEVSSEFNRLRNSFFHCSWYLFPMKLQHLMPTVINFAQKDVRMNGIGSLACTRESFKQIVKGSFTYYTLFRLFNQ